MLILVLEDRLSPYYMLVRHLRERVRIAAKLHHSLRRSGPLEAVVSRVTGECRAEAVVGSGAVAMRRACHGSVFESVLPTF